MTKRMTATDAKNRWGDLIKAVVDQGEPVIGENRREPVVVVISPSEFEEFQALRKEEWLREARATLHHIQEIQRKRTQNLSDAEADALIERLMEEDRLERAEQSLDANR